MSTSRWGLVLASASPARAKTLTNAGVIFEVQISSVDEEALTGAAGPMTPIELAGYLARHKAEDIASRWSATQGTALADRSAVIVGCDSVLEVDGIALGKPGSADVARERLRQISGRSAILQTGHWLIDQSGDHCQGFTASTEVHFADLTDAEIEAYVATGEPLHVAGSFTVDGRGGAFVRAVTGDIHNVVGISLPRLREALATWGVPWHLLW